MMKHFFIGAITGFSAGLLFAPDSGKNTRRNIQQKIDDIGSDFQDDIQEYISGVKIPLKAVLIEINERLTEMERQLKEDMAEREVQYPREETEQNDAEMIE